jgi:nitrite reductase/ring-hydroxylating ferredoxin subunit
MTSNESPGLRLCRLDELPDGDELDAVGFPADAPHRAGIFVLREGAGVKAFVNRCPHQGTPLNWTPDRFLDLERKHIICATHGAVFKIEDGFCISGPCSGDALEPVAAEIRDGEVYVVDWQNQR